MLHYLVAVVGNILFYRGVVTLMVLFYQKVPYEKFRFYIDDSELLEIRC